MAVNGNDRLVDIGDPVHDLGDDAAEFGRNRVAHGIGNIDGGGARVDRFLDHAAELIDRGAPCVFAGEFDVVRIFSRLLHGGDAHGEHVVEGLAELVLHMYRGRGDEGVYSEVLGGLQCLSGHVDVLDHGAREAAGNGVLERSCNQLNGFEVALGGNGKARFNDVNAELFERERNLKLLPFGEALRKRLFAVAQRCVEDDYSVLTSHVPSSFVVVGSN